MNDEKPTITYRELVREHRRIEMLKTWNEINLEHTRDGCPLDIPEDQPRPIVCVIHGYFKGDMVMTRAMWMGELDE